MPPLHALVAVLLVLALASACESSPKREPAPTAKPPATAREQPVAPRSGPAIAFEIARAWEEPARADEVSPKRRAFFEAGPSFEALGTPKPGDWLAEHPEDGQTFAQFVASRPNLPTADRHTVYIVPLEPWSPPAGAPSLRDVAEYVSLFFGLPVRVTRTEGEDLAGVTSRVHARTGKRQLLSRDILDRLRARVPRDAYAVMALTQTDLYPDPKWNYVFGEAMLRERVAVHSLARYSSAFFGGEEVGEDVMKQRILGVSAHEIGHMFGLEHCTAHRCVLNGANSLEEADRGPMHLCPVCLRKLHHSTGVAPAARYRALRDYYERAGLADEAKWVEGRLAEAGADGGRGAP